MIWVDVDVDFDVGDKKGGRKSRSYNINVNINVSVNKNKNKNIFERNKMSTNQHQSKIKTSLLSAALLLVPALSLFAQDVADDGLSDDIIPPPQGLFGGNFLFIMVAMFAIIYFVVIRPEQRRQKEQQKERQRMLAALKKGDRVVTIGGLVGAITAVKDNTYIIKSGEGAVFEITKSAISSQVTDARDIASAGPSDAPQADAKESR